MEIKFLNIRLIRAQQLDLLAEDIVKRCLFWSFWFAFPGVYQVWKWVEPYLELLRGLVP